MEKLLIIFIVGLGCLTALGIISLDTFMGVWSNVFVFIVKGAIFAMIPCGFLLAIYLALTGQS